MQALHYSQIQCKFCLSHHVYLLSCTSVYCLTHLTSVYLLTHQCLSLISPVSTTHFTTVYQIISPVSLTNIYLSHLCIVSLVSTIPHLLIICLTCVMLLYDVDQLVDHQVDLMSILPLIVSQHPILLQVLHLIRVRYDRLQGCTKRKQSHDKPAQSDWTLSKEVHFPFLASL